MSVHIYYAIIYSVIMLLSFGMRNVRRNPVYGIRFSSTLGDNEVWKETNRKAAQLITAICIIFLTVQIFFFLFHSPPIYATILFIIFAVVLSLIVMYLYIYSKNLLKDKGKKPIKVSEFPVSKSLIYSMILVSILTLIAGVLSTFIGPNPYIGIRTGKTLQSVTIWRKVNTFAGIGFAIIGATFTYRFMQYINRAKNAKKFWTDLITFTISVLIWSAISVIYAYI